ncbi:hypothetical protein [Archaeoglobus neptunius]|uniref:hypothetical protein n=1 Tax=Archaeoglobus neptunius TaxID=2798580 RepID=UPI001926DD7F|nr:hypothetical protein [Archaeoglobus neptunius]
MKMQIAILLFLITVTPATGWELLDGPVIKSVYKDWDGENWLIVQAYSDTAGERWIYTPSQYSTVLTHQSCTFGFGYGEGKCYFGICYLPDSREHKIVVKAENTPSNVRITDPFGYDNEERQSIPEIVRFALDALWNFAVSYIKLPLPSPWGLMLQEEGNRLDISRSSDLKECTFRFKAEPNLQGADWLWYIDKPVNAGWYFISVYVQAEAGLFISSLHGQGFVKVEDVSLLMWPNFKVYRG